MQRTGLNPFGTFHDKQGALVECLIDSYPRVGGRTTFYLFDPGSKLSFGSAYTKIREDELVMSNIDMGNRQRQGVASGLVDLLLNHFPDHKVSVENPNFNSLAWHKSLVGRFGERIIPLTQAEIDATHRRWDDAST